MAGTRRFLVAVKDDTVAPLADPGLDSYNISSPCERKTNSGLKIQPYSQVVFASSRRHLVVIGVSTGISGELMSKTIERPIAWPRKQREHYSNHMDSRIWNDLNFRNDDIVIATYAKSGTTWMQQIVSQLIFEGREGLPLSRMSFWIDNRGTPNEKKLRWLDEQTHRRFFKTHLPADTIVISPQAKYIYIGRDGRDVCWSFHHHHLTASNTMFEALNSLPDRIGPPFEPANPDPVAYFREWLEKDGFPWWPAWENIRSWWAIRHLPNILLVHFDMLKQAPEKEIRRIAQFLDISVDEKLWPVILEHCSFEYMKSHGEKIVPHGGVLWKEGAQSFMNKGINGRWRDVLPQAESHAYEERAIQELGAECAHWLKTGVLADAQS
jgi:aryl sulfotransferase